MATATPIHLIGAPTALGAARPTAHTTADDLVVARRFIPHEELLGRLFDVRERYLASPPPSPPSLSSLVVTPVSPDGWAFSIDDDLTSVGAPSLHAPGSTGRATTAEHVWHVAAAVYLLLAAGTRATIKLPLLRHRLEMGSPPSILEYRSNVPGWAALALARALSARSEKRQASVEALFVALEAPERTDTLAGIRIDPAVFAEALRKVEEAPVPPAAPPPSPTADEEGGPPSIVAALAPRRPVGLIALGAAVGAVAVLALGIAIGRSVGPWHPLRLHLPPGWPSCRCPWRLPRRLPSWTRRRPRRRPRAARLRDTAGPARRAWSEARRRLRRGPARPGRRHPRAPPGAPAPPCPPRPTRSSSASSDEAPSVRVPDPRGDR